MNNNRPVKVQFFNSETQTNQTISFVHPKSAHSKAKLYAAKHNTEARVYYKYHCWHWFPNGACMVDYPPF